MARKLNTMLNDHQLLVNARVTASQLHKGVVSLAIVANVRPTYLIVHMPFGIVGTIQNTDAMDCESMRPLNELYKIGDYVIGVVIGQDVSGKPLLGIKPSLFYQREFARKSLVICQIETVEDHGWIAEMKDLRGTVGFLSKARVPEELHAKLQPGFVAQCAVLDVGAHNKLLQLSLQRLDLTVSATFNGYGQVFPGQIVKAEVMQTSSTHSVARLISNGVPTGPKGPHLGKIHGYILSEHLRRPKDRSGGYSTYAGFKGKFRVIYTDLNPQTTDVDNPLVYLSNMDSLIDYLAPVQVYSVGQILQENKLTMVQTMKGAVFAAFSDELASFLYIPAESTNHGGAADAQLGEFINMKVKILGYRQFDDLYIGTANTGDIVSSVEAEFHSGMILSKSISVKVVKVLDNGLHVSIDVSSARSLHGMINLPHYGTHLKSRSIPIGLNINKGYGTLRVLAYDEPRQVYYLSLANLGSDPLFSSRETVKPGMVSRGVVMSFIDNAKCAAVVQFTNLYSAICANATGMEIGNVYEFICVRNDEKYTTVDRLSESRNGDNVAKLRSNHASGLMRVLEYRHFIKAELPYSSTIDGTGNLNVPIGTLLHKENAVITIRGIALGGFKLSVKMIDRNEGDFDVFLPYNCIAFPGKAAMLIDLYLGADNSEEFEDFFSILPFVRLLISLTTRDGFSLHIAASSEFLGGEGFVLPQENGDMVKGAVYQVIVTHKSNSGLTAKLGAHVDLFYPDFGCNELDNIFPLTLIQVRPTKIGERRLGHDRKVDVKVVAYCSDGIMKPLLGRKMNDDVPIAPAKSTYAKLILPNTRQINPDIHKLEDCKDGMPLRGSYLFANTSSDAYCSIYDLGCGIVGRLTLEAVVLGRLAAKVSEDSTKSVDIQSLLNDFNVELAKIVAGGDLTLTAYFERRGPHISEDGLADVLIRDLITLYGDKELSEICADTDHTSGEQSCDIVDLYPGLLSAKHLKSLRSTISKAKITSLAMVRSVSTHHMILRDIFDNDFVFVHAVDVFQDPLAVKPLTELYKPGFLVQLSSFASRNVPNPVIAIGISRLGPISPLEEALFSSPVGSCSIAAVKPPNKLSGMQRTICQILPSGALRLNGYSSMCFLTATSPISFDGNKGLFTSPVLSVTRLFNDPQDFSEDTNEFIDNMLGYHKCVRIDSDNVSIRPIDFQVSSMSRHSFISVGQEHLFLPQTIEDISIHDTYVGFVRPYSKVGAGIQIVVSESITFHVKMKEISEDFITSEEVLDKYPPYTKVRIRYLDTTQFNGTPQYNGTIKPSVVNNPNVKHPSVIIKAGACLIGKVDNVLDDRGVFITVEDCYPLTRVRARISDAIDSSGYGPGDSGKIVMNNANRCSNNYYRGQRLYFIVLEPTEKGATVGLKAAHFLAAGIDIAKLPVLKQDRVKQSKQHKMRVMQQEELLRNAAVSDMDSTEKQTEGWSNIEPIRKKARSYDLFSGEMADEKEQSSETHRSILDSESSDSDVPAASFLNFGKAKRTKQDDSDYSQDYDMLEQGLLGDDKREYEIRQQQKLTAEQKKIILEKDIRDKEEELLTNAAPQTEADFERLLAGNEQSSYLWIRYVAFHVDRANINKAESVMDRAIAKVSPDKEADYRNLWLAKVALKEKFSGADAGLNELHEAMRRNDPNELLRTYCTGKLEQNDWETASKGYELLLSKRERKKIYENWRDYILFLYNTQHYDIPSDTIEANRARARTQELQKASSSLPQDTMLRLFCDAARAEYKIGDVERGRAAFDKLVGSMPQRMDIWGQYLDMEEKYVASTNPQHVRTLYERCCSFRLSLKRMTYVLKRFYSFENRFGTATTQERVKEIARAYADS